MIDRSIIPEIKEVEEVQLLDYELVTIDSGVPVYVFNAGSQEVMALELVFEAGSWFQDKLLIASCTNAMLKEGTKTYSSSEINETIDYHGAFLQNDLDKDVATVSLYTLNKHFNSVLPILNEVVSQPTFPQKNLQAHLKRIKQKHKVNLEKNSFLARQKFLSVLFGEAHPYGRNATEADFDNVSDSDLSRFFTENYTSGNCKIFLAGKITDEVLRKLNDGLSLNKPKATKTFDYEIAPSVDFKHFVKIEKSVQSAIRIGKRTISKSHPDFAKLQITNTILGGYFGSRLMSNIREDKGYTYGIGSFVAPMLRDGYFGISTEVGVDVTQKALDEIYKEIELLRSELVSQEELGVVKSYLMGELLKSVDGPFSLAERWKGIILHGLDKEYFDSMVKTIQSITPEDILQTAKKYLDTSDMYEVVVGMK